MAPKRWSGTMAVAPGGVPGGRGLVALQAETSCCQTLSLNPKLWRATLTMQMASDEMRAKMTPPLEPLPMVDYMHQHLAGEWLGFRLGLGCGRSGPLCLPPTPVPVVACASSSLVSGRTSACARGALGQRPGSAQVCCAVLRPALSGVRLWARLVCAVRRAVRHA